jgi:hypothetical protein|eukprot:COSAG01_NODE_16698_length_1213_cov_2.000000_3_plen_62_part_00
MMNPCAGRVRGLRERSAALRARLPPERKHIAMSEETILRLDVEGPHWAEKWPRTLQNRFRL